MPFGHPPAGGTLKTRAGDHAGHPQAGPGPGRGGKTAAPVLTARDDPPGTDAAGTTQADQRHGPAPQPPGSAPLHRLPLARSHPGAVAAHRRQHHRPGRPGVAPLTANRKQQAGEDQPVTVSPASEMGPAALAQEIATTRPKLPGLSDREPDFMWIATDSGSLHPVLVEIETPHKAWFYGDRAEIHSDFETEPQVSATAIAKARDNGRRVDRAAGQPGPRPRLAVRRQEVLIRDRGSNFTRALNAVFQATGARILRTAVRASRMNAICERLVGTLHRELLDRVLIARRSRGAVASSRNSPWPTAVGSVFRCRPAAASGSRTPCRSVRSGGGGASCISRLAVTGHDRAARSAQAHGAACDGGQDADTAPEPRPRRRHRTQLSCSFACAGWPRTVRACHRGPSGGQPCGLFAGGGIRFGW